MACFHFEPVPWIEENQVPEFQQTAEDVGDLMTVDEADEIFWAWAYDPDGDENAVSFFWKQGTTQLSPEPIPPKVDENGITYYGSLVYLVYDPEFDGEELVCDVYDSEGGHKQATWPLEVL